MLSEIGFEVLLNKPYDQALDLTKDALMEEGFGIMTSIDVKKTMKEKLDEEFRPYSILGACNPALAHRALHKDAVVGLVLPCNVTVEADGSSASIIRIANPETILSVGSLMDDPDLSAVAQEARVRLERVAEALLAA
jgi:uncharacterized protein (DUF302 family)